MEFQNPSNLTNEEIIQFTSTFFLPLECVVEVWDYDQKLRLRVLDSDDRPLVSCPSVATAEVRSEAALISFLSVVKQRAIEKSV